MTDYFVGKGGSDVNNGTTWALRKLTISAAELLSLVAGDNVWVGPGVYREQLALTNGRSGSAGQPITYAGDISGKMTDGVGGEVVITGSDNDDTTARSFCIRHWGTGSVHYRTFRGFAMELSSSACFMFSGGGASIYSNIIVEDCVIHNENRETIIFEDIDSASFSGIIIRRCVLGIVEFSGDAYDIGARIENCIFSLNIYSATIGYLDINDVYGITISNCTFFPNNISSRYVITISGTNNNLNYLYNSIFHTCRIFASTTNLLIEDYNVYQRVVPSGDVLTNITPGGNSVEYALLFMPPLLHSGGLIYPEPYYTFAPYSQVPGLACNGEAAPDDFYGITRPSLYAKKTRGAIQHNIAERETTTVYGSSVESLKLSDAMVVQTIIPITGKSMSVSARVNRESNYVGVPPQIIIKQDGEADIVATDSGGAASWNLLRVSFKPASLPQYLAVEFRSNNEASSGDFGVFFDDLKAK